MAKLYYRAVGTRSGAGRRRSRSLVTVAALTAICAPTIQAQLTPTHIWNGTASDNWSGGANWTPAAPISAVATVLQFNAAGTTTYTATNDIANPFQLNGLLLNSTSSGVVTLNGSPLQFVTNVAALPELELLAGSTGTVNIANDLTLTNNLTIDGIGTSSLNLAGSVGGAGNLTIQTAGTVNLSGNNSGLTGSTTLNRGTLVLDYTSSNTAKLNASGTLTFGTANGGTGALTILGNAAAGTTQSFTGTTFNPGHVALSITSGAGQSAALNLGALTRSSGSTIALTLNPVGGGTSTLTATAPGADTLLNNVIVGGNSFAVHQTGSGNIVAFSGYVDKNDVTTWTAGDNVNNTAAYTGTTTGAASVNSIRFDAAVASSFTVGTAATDSLTVGSGGILVTGNVGANASTIGSFANALTGPFINTAAATDLVLANNSAGTLTINPNIGTSAAAPQAIVKTGTGAVTLSNTAMRYSANGIFVNQGTLNVGTSVTLTAVTFNNSTHALRNPLGTTTAGVATPVTLGDGATINAAFGTSANLTATFGNSIRVPQGVGTFNGSVTGGSATSLITLGAITLGDDARLNLSFTGTMRYQFTGGINILPGAPGQPTSATLNITGGAFHTFTGTITGSPGGSTLNLAGNSTFTFNSGTAATNLTRINLLNSGMRLYINNNTLIGQTATSTAINLVSGTYFATDQNVAHNFLQPITVASGAGIISRQNTTTLLANGFPTAGLVIFNNDNSATTGITLSGNYPALTGPMTFQIGGGSNTTGTNALGGVTISNGLDASSAALGGTFTLTADYAPTAASTPATTNLVTVNGNTAIGANNLVVDGDGSLTLANVTTTGPGTNSITKNGTGFLTLNGANTFSGGVNVSAGSGLGLAASSTVTGGNLASGPLGTGMLTLGAGANVRDTNGDRTIHNNVVAQGNLTFGSTGLVGTITFDDAGLTTPSTFSINAAANPTITVNNVSTTLSQAIPIAGGATGFTKAGAGSLVIDGDLPDSSTISVANGTLVLTPAASTSASFIVNSGATIRVEGSSLAFNNADNKVTLNSGATASRGVGVDTAEFQAWLGATGATSIVVAISADSADAFDFTGNSGRRLGSTPSGYVFNGTLTPDGTTYRLGGGGGVLYYNSALVDSGGARSLDVGLGGSAAGEVVLTNPANTFTGGTSFSSAIALSIKNGTSLGSGPLTFGVAGATLVALAPTTVASPVVTTAAGTIDNRGNALTLSGGASGTGAITLTGPGTTTISTTAIDAATPVVATAGNLSTALTGAPFGGANFVMHGNVSLTAGAATSTIAGTSASTFTYNAGTLNVGSTGSPGTTLTLGGTGASFIRGAQGLLVIAPANGTANLGTAGGETVKVGGTAPTATNGIVPSVFGRDASGAGTFLNYDATNGFVPATYVADTFGATNNVDVTAAATLTAATSANAVRANANVAINPPTLNTSIALTVGTGGVILNGGNITQTANGTGVGQLAFGAADGKIYTHAAGGTISAIMTGTGGVSITGPGTTTLSGANTFTGNLVVDGGTLAFSSFTDSNTAGTGTPLGNTGTGRNIILNGGGTARLTSGTYNPTSGRVFRVDAGGGVMDALGGTTYQLDDANQLGSVTNTAGTLRITNSGTGSGVVLLTNQTFTLNGPIIVGSSTGTAVLRYGNNQNTTVASTLGNSLAAALTLNAGGEFDMRTVIAWTRPIVLNGGSITSGAASGTINGTVYTMSGGGTIGGTNTINVNGEIVLDGAPITFGGTGSVNVNGVISGALNNTLGITKLGTGTAFLNAANNYGGTTEIQAGILDVDNDAALGVSGSPITFTTTGGGALRFGSQFTLGGTRPISVAAGAIGGFDTNGLNINLTQPVTTTATSNLRKTGAGTLTMDSPVVTPGTLTAAGGTLTLTGANTITNLVVGDSGATHNLTAPGASITVNGTVLVGVTASASSAATNGVMDLTNATFNANVTTFEVGKVLGAAGSAVGTVLFPATTSVTASTSFIIASSPGPGNTAGISTVTFGSGSSTLNTPILRVGAVKSRGLLNIAAGGTLTIDNGAGTTALTIALQDPGSGTNSTGELNTTGGTLIADLGTVVVGDRGTTANAATGTAVGSFILGNSALNNVSATGIILGRRNTGGNTTGTFTAPGGTVTVGAGGITDGTGTSNLNITGATVVMANSNIGSAANPIDAMVFSGGVIRNAAQIFATGGLTQTATATSTLLDVLGNNTTVNGVYSLTGSGANTATVDVASTRTLTATSITAGSSAVVKGNGTIAGPLTLDAGSTIAPGGSVGLLTTGNETWNANASYQWEISAVSPAGVPGTDWDMLEINGNLVVPATDSSPGNAFIVAVTRLGAAQTTSYQPGDSFTIAHVNGTISGPLVAGDNFTITDLGLGQPWEISAVDLGAGNGFNVVLTIVPEPATVSLLALGGIGLLSSRRRRVVK